MVVWPRYKVSGIDSETRFETSLVVEASTPLMAKKKAELRGIVVTEVRPLASHSDKESSRRMLIWMIVVSLSIVALSVYWRGERPTQQEYRSNASKRPELTGNLEERVRTGLSHVGQTQMIDTTTLTCDQFVNQVRARRRILEALEQDMGVQGEWTPAMFMLMFGRPATRTSWSEGQYALVYDCKNGNVTLYANRYLWDRGKFETPRPPEDVDIREINR